MGDKNMIVFERKTI